MNIEKAGINTSHVVFILDASSSMQQIKQETIQSFNSFLQVQKESKISTNISLYTFSGFSISTVVDNKPAELVEPLDNTSYRPLGMTNLLDAIGTVVQKTNNKLMQVANEFRPSVVIVVLTDGEENSSKEFTSSDIKELVLECEEKDWTFTFLGANIDAFKVGSVLGFSPTNTLQYNVSNIGNTIAAAADMTERLKFSRSVGLSAQDAYTASAYTAEERNNAGSGNN